MKLEIFDVEHGQCALLTGDGGDHMLIDAGHNSTTGWRPSQMLERRRIRHLDGLIITNEDEDHASDLDHVLRVASVGTFYANPTISGDDIVNLKNQDRCGPGIFALADLLDVVVPATAGLHFDGVYVESFWNDYPRHFEDENNLSLVTFLHLPGLRVCFPGDIERAGWLRLLQNRDFRAVMRGVHVFMASHHGRENGYSESLFRVTGLRPVVVVISDCGIQYATQETVASYRQWATGLPLKGQHRRVLTTRRDGMITLTRGPHNWLLDTYR